LSSWGEVEDGVGRERERGRSRVGRGDEVNRRKSWRLPQRLPQKMRGVRLPRRRGGEGVPVVGDEMGLGVEGGGGVAEGGEPSSRMKFEEALGVYVGSEVAGRGGAGRREGKVIFRFVVGEGLGEKTLKAEGAMEKLGWDKVERGGGNVDRVGGNGMGGRGGGSGTVREVEDACAATENGNRSAANAFYGKAGGGSKVGEEGGIVDDDAVGAAVNNKPAAVGVADETVW
jgi:hypothetical protein